MCYLLVSTVIRVATGSTLLVLKLVFWHTSELGKFEHKSEVAQYAQFGHKSELTQFGHKSEVAQFGHI